MWGPISISVRLPLPQRSLVRNMYLFWLPVLYNPWRCDRISDTPSALGQIGPDERNTCRQTEISHRKKWPFCIPYPGATNGPLIARGFVECDWHYRIFFNLFPQSESIYATVRARLLVSLGNGYLAYQISAPSNKRIASHIYIKLNFLAP